MARKAWWRSISGGEQLFRYKITDETGKHPDIYRISTGSPNHITPRYCGRLFFIQCTNKEVQQTGLAACLYQQTERKIIVI